MKNTLLAVFIFFGLFFAIAPQTQAYSLPDGGVYFGCLWRDASCTANSVQENVPTSSEMSQFYFSVIEACTTAGYNGGVCALQASKAVVAADTYTTCMVGSGGDSVGCKTATDFKVNEVTTAKPAPIDPNAPVPTQPQAPTNLCSGFTDQSEQTRCSEILGVCGGASSDECQKTAAITTISLSVQEDCRGRGVPASECLIQYDAAVAESQECLSSLAGQSVMQCKNEAQIAAQQAAILAAEAATPPQPPPQTPTTPTQNQTQTQGTSPINTSYTGNGNLGYTPLEPLPGLAEVQGGNTNFARLLQSGFSVLISIGALSAVVMLIFGGITYMVSDVVHKKTGALHRIQAALWGLLLLVASWLILNTINPSLTNFALILNPTPPPSVSGLNTVTSGTVGNFTVADSDPNRDSKLSNWCPGGLPDQVSSQPDEFGTQFSTYVCSPPDSR